MFFAQDDNMIGIDFETTEEELLRHHSTKHGFVRTMERTNLNDTRIVYFIRSAWRRGKKPEDFPTKQRKKYTAKYVSLMENGKTQVRIYQDYVFIFSPDNRLITMYEFRDETPQNDFGKPKRKIVNIHKHNQLLNAYSHTEEYEELNDMVSCYY